MLRDNALYKRYGLRKHRHVTSKDAVNKLVYSILLSLKALTVEVWIDAGRLHHTIVYL